MKPILALVNQKGRFTVGRALLSDVVPWIVSIFSLIGVYYIIFWVATIGSADPEKIMLAESVLNSKRYGIAMLLVYMLCAFLAVRTKKLWFWVPLVLSFVTVKLVGATSLATLIAPNTAITLMVNFIGYIALWRMIECVQLRRYEFADATVSYGVIVLYGLIGVACLVVGNQWIARLVFPI